VQVDRVRLDAQQSFQHCLGARTIYAEILAIDPNHNEATISIEMIDKEEFARRRERRRRILFATGLGAVVAAFGTALVLEVSARIACIEARSLLSRERVIEQGHYQDAIAVWQRVRSDHPWTPTAWFDLPRQIADLEERAAEAATLMLPAPIGR
jgi:hypothetical protein